MILLELGNAVGLSATIGIILLTGAIGAWAARTQGFYVLGRIQRDLAENRLPGVQLIEGAMVLVGGIFLITPGLLTDSIGFALMIPAVRGILREILISKFQKMVEEGKVRIHHG